jgi:hypothetical protein
MAESFNYVPRLNDSVLLEGSDHSLIVTHVDASRRTAGLTTLAGPVIHTKTCRGLSSAPKSAITLPAPIEGSNKN